MKVDKILVIVAHPDDEVLGCGGTIAKHIMHGDDVSILILADGVSSRHSTQDFENEIQERRNSLIAAGDILGVKDIKLFSYPDNRMDSIVLLDVIQVIEKVMIETNANIIYTHHSGDVNIDHRIVHDAVIAACRPQPHSNIEKLLFFEIPSSTEWRPPTSAEPFIPNWYVDITATLDKKLDAMKAYEEELRDFPHARSLAAIKSLAIWRGATVGVQAAEAFVLGRNILK